MSQSLSKMWAHLIFSTKERYPFLSYPFLSDQSTREQTHKYIAGILRKNDCPTLLVGGAADHVHSLFVLSKNHSIADIVYEVKRSSSKWIKTQGKPIQEVLLAEWLRRVLCQPVSCRASAPLHRWARSDTIGGLRFKMNSESSCDDMKWIMMSDMSGIDR